MGQGSTTD